MINALFEFFATIDVILICFILLVIIAAGIDKGLKNIKGDKDENKPA